MQRHWNELKEFLGVDLQDTFVLKWALLGDVLTFDLLISLWPENLHYEAPKENEHTCYKEGKLKFLTVPRVEGIKDMSDVPSSRDPDGSEDYGTIDDLHLNTEGFWILAGDFGEFKFKSSGFDFKVAT